MRIVGGFDFMVKVGNIGVNCAACGKFGEQCFVPVLLKFFNVDDRGISPEALFINTTAVLRN